MPTRADLLVLLGPLADILPREAVVVIAGLAAMLAAAVCGRALAQRRPVLFAVGWAAGMAAVAVLQAGLDGLMRYGAGVRVADAVPLGEDALSPPGPGLVAAGGLRGGDRQRDRHHAGATPAPKPPGRERAGGVHGGQWR